MKLRIVLLDSDKNYMERLVSAFRVRREYDLETYSFTDPQDALSALRGIGADFLAADEGYEIDPGSIPEGCSFAYLTDSASGEVRGHNAICRYQKAELIYKEILSIYSDQNGGSSAFQDSGNKAGHKTARIYVFAPCGGGSGASSAAAACALRFTRSGKSVLYLNFERFGSSGAYFEAEGRLRLGDVLYAVKSKRTNFGMKLRSAVKRDESGVYFIDSCKVALEVMEITEGDIAELFEELKALGMFDIIIADVDLLLEGAPLSLMKMADIDILVSDGSETSAIKLERLAGAMEIISERDGFPFPSVRLLYNRYSNKSSISADIADFVLLGTAPEYGGASRSRIIRQLAELPIFDRLP